MRALSTVFLVVVALQGCDESEPVSATQADVGPVTLPPAGDSQGAAAQVMAVDTLAFTRPADDGTVIGFDLDGRISDATDEATCGKADFTSPGGTPGIDNQLAILTPLFDLVGIGAVEDLVQGAIEEGGLLILFELAGLDDPVNDDEVTLRLRLGAGVPLLGTNGLLLSGQTFGLHDDSPDLVLANARVEDGVLIAGPFDTQLPIVVFGVLYNLDVKNARLRGTLTFDGGLDEAMLAGGVPLANLMEIAEVAEMEASGIIDAVTSIISGIGDLDPGPDGACRQMSATLAITAVSAFLTPEAP